MSEADERLVAGPRGVQGEQGRRGERGLSRLQGRAVVVLFLIAVLPGVGGWFWQAREITANNHKFCQVISGVTAVPVPAPADPGANPSREKQFELYQTFVRLGQGLGCRENHG